MTLKGGSKKIVHYKFALMS